MEQLVKDAVWSQFGASISMLENAIEMCPEDQWDTPDGIWYNAYHCLFFLDYYLTMKPAGFKPPPPFTLSEFEDEMPPRIYSKQELLDYLAFCRGRCKQLIAAATSDFFSQRWINQSGSMNFSVLEILIYNMRHVQHHAAQLNLLLRKNINNAPQWVNKADE